MAISQKLGAQNVITHNPQCLTKSRLQQVLSEWNERNPMWVVTPRPDWATELPGGVKSISSPWPSDYLGSVWERGREAVLGPFLAHLQVWWPLA